VEALALTGQRDEAAEASGDEDSVPAEGLSSEEARENLVQQTQFEISQLTALLAEARSRGDLAAADRFKQCVAKQSTGMRALRE
jgi:hypothetical protein